MKTAKYVIEGLTQKEHWEIMAYLVGQLLCAVDTHAESGETGITLAVWPYSAPGSSRDNNFGLLVNELADRFELHYVN